MLFTFMRSLVVALENFASQVFIGISLLGWIVADYVDPFFHRVSGSDSNIDHFPPSAACFNFSREEIFCHLVQSLLLAKSPIFNRLILGLCCRHFVVLLYQTHDNSWSSFLCKGVLASLSIMLGEHMPSKYLGAVTSF